MCDSCEGIAHRSVDDRMNYMLLQGLAGDCSLAQQRLAWLMLQEMRGKAYAPPMPEDPVPAFWPSSERKQPSQGTLGTVARIKEALRIEDIAARLTTLHGNSVLKGKCPLHGEQNGEAFTVWVEDQKWRCFGQCNTGGDVLDLIEACMDRGIEWQTSATS